MHRLALIPSVEAKEARSGAGVPAQAEEQQVPGALPQQAARTKPTPMQKKPDERALREQIALLRAEHRDLDDQIASEEGSGMSDQLLIRRLKKRKLALKDQITSLEDQLLPDIIA
jgi:hypothetical protein